MTLIEVRGVLTYKPLSKSKARVDQVVGILGDGRITSQGLQQDFAKYLAIILQQRVQRSVDTQAIGRRPMRSLYKPLSSKYRARKIPLNRDKFWINTDYLIKNLSVWRRGGIINVGYRPRQLHPESKTPLSDIIKYLEEGTETGIPPRPLFTPHAIFIRKNISRYFDAYLRLKYG